MDNKTTFEIFKNQIMKPKNHDKVIGNIIVNQKIISGIGNYLRADILWLSCISPFKKVKDIKDAELLTIFKNAKILTHETKTTKKNKLPSDYKRNFFVYKCNKDIYDNDVICENLGDRKIYWVPKIQK